MSKLCIGIPCHFNFLVHHRLQRRMAPRVPLQVLAHLCNHACAPSLPQPQFISFFHLEAKFLTLNWIPFSLPSPLCMCLLVPIYAPTAPYKFFPPYTSICKLSPLGKCSCPALECMCPPFGTRILSFMVKKWPFLFKWCLHLLCHLGNRVTV